MWNKNCLKAFSIFDITQDHQLLAIFTWDTEISHRNYVVEDFFMQLLFHYQRVSRVATCVRVIVIEFGVIGIEY